MSDLLIQSNAYFIGSDISGQAGNFHAGSYYPHFGIIGLKFATGQFTTPSTLYADHTYRTLVNATEYNQQQQVRFTTTSLNNPFPGYSGSSEYGDATFVRETTYTRSGGSTDGVNAFSYKLAACAAQSIPLSLEYYNTKVGGSFLVTFDFLWSSTGTGLTSLTKEDVWIEAAYYNTSGPKELMDYVFSFDKYNRKGLVYNGSAPDYCETSSATWNGGLTGAVKQKVSIVVSPKKAGIIKFYIGVWRCPWTQNICLLGQLTTMPIYFDPMPTFSAAP